MDKDTYYRQMFEYYDGAKYNYHFDSVRQSVIDRYRKYGKGLSYILDKIPMLFTGRRVLELACGGGFFTKYLAEVAEFVLAFDFSPNLIEVAKGLGEAENMEFMVCDALNLDRLPGTFNAAFHVGFISHVPLADWDELLSGLHNRLDPGAVVFMEAGSAFQGEHQKPNQEDFFTRRPCKNGTTYEIVDNTFCDKESIASRLGPNATDIQFFRPKSTTNYWWVSYVVTK